MTPDESAEWRRLSIQLVYLLESREQSLKDLKTLRHEVRADSGRSAWKGFSGNPPYPLDALANLYDHIFALRSEVDALEVQRAVREANLNSFLKSREISEKQLRQAEDLLTKSAGKETAVRARWHRDLARLRNEINSEGALAEDMAQFLAAEKIRSKRKVLQSLEEQYRSAEVSSPLSGEDLDRTLAKLEERRKDREKLLAAAIQEERFAKKALEKALTDGSKTAGQTERIRLETAASKIEIYQGLLRILNFEEALWQDRYRLSQVEDLVDLRKKRAEVDKSLKQLGSWKEAFGKTTFSYVPLVLSETEKLRSGTLSKEEEGFRPVTGRRLPGAPRTSGTRSVRRSTRWNGSPPAGGGTWITVWSTPRPPRAPGRPAGPSFPSSGSCGTRSSTLRKRRRSSGDRRSSARSASPSGRSERPSSSC